MQAPHTALRCRNPPPQSFRSRRLLQAAGSLRPLAAQRAGRKQVPWPQVAAASGVVRYHLKQRGGEEEGCIVCGSRRQRERAPCRLRSLAVAPG